MQRWSIAGMSVLVAGCAAAQSRPPAPAVPADTVIVAPQTPVREAPIRIRHAVRPVEPSRAFTDAVERGTRTSTGSPGRAYWQQQVAYRIDAELDPATATVQGEELVTYTNNSPDTLRSVLMHLYQNAFSHGVQRVRQVPITGGVTLRRVVVGDVEARNADDARRRTAGAAPSYRVDGTLLWIDLARGLAPGRSVDLEVGWQFEVPPPGAPRTGHDDHEAFVVAQWYPQVAVYDDIRGWHDTPYWTNGEFYLEYASFDVSLTVPEGWLVTATGELQNPTDVLTPETEARIARARASDNIVHVVTADHLEQQTATARQPGGQLTWRFVARNVRDFAFATSDRYVWDASRVRLPDADGNGAQESVLVSALYRPGTAEWENAVDYMRHTVAFHAREWGPYIYPHITAAEGPIGGMEYPMLVFIGGSRTPQSLYSVLSHEIAHEWWPMMVGSNESHNAWQDEGLASYVEDLSLRDYFEDERPALATQASYLNIAGSDAEKPIVTRPDLFGIGPQYGVAAYSKPATMLRALTGVIGQETVHRGLREYTTRWLLKHPSPYDFFNVMEDVAARDLDWFWSAWFFETAVLDQAIADVTIETAGPGDRVSVVVADSGTAPMPVRLVLTMADGTTREVELPVAPWLDGLTEQTITVDLPARLARIDIDPDMLFPDIDRSDNVWVRR